MLLVVIATALAVIFDGHTAHAQDDFYDAKIHSEYSDVSLYCSNTTTLPFNDTAPVSWMLPNLTVIYHSKERFNITNDNWTLTITNATQDDLGQYHCLLPVSGGSDYYLVKLGLNAEGPYFEDLWEKYMWNTIIGVSAAGGFALLSIFLYLLDRFRYREPETVDRKRELHAAIREGDGPYEVLGVGQTKYPLEERENGFTKHDLNSHSNHAFNESAEEGTYYF